MPSAKLFLIMFSSGVAATLAWQSHGDAARQIIARSHPQLGWLAPPAAQIVQSAPGMIGLAAQAAPSPDQQRLNAISLDLGAMRQTVDRIANNQEQITRSVDRLTAGQEQMTREISKLQAVEQQVKPPPRPALASARNPVRRSSPSPTVR